MKQTAKYMGQKEYGTFMQKINDGKVSKILEMGDFKEAKWSKTVMQIAEECSSNKRQKSSTWKANRQLRKAKKLISRKIMEKKTTKGEKTLLKMQKTLIDEHIWTEMMTRKKTLIDKTVESVKQDGGVDSNTFWEVRKRIMGKKSEEKHAIRDENGEIKTDEIEIKTVYERYFCKLLGEKSRCEGKQGKETEEMVERIINSMETVAKCRKSKPVDGEVVKQVIGKLKKRKSSDREGWRNEMIQMGGEEMEKSIIRICDRVITTMEIPEEFNSMTILTIHKKNSKLMMENKRGLFLTNIISKVVERVIKKRNTEDMRENSSEMQNGGKEGRSPIDNLFMAWSIIERRKYLQQDTYMVFIDMQKCFDISHY